MFAKVFSQIYDSSIVEDSELRYTFMDMLVLADRNGVVDMTHEAIARRTNRPIETIRRTILLLEGPDKCSRTPDYAGARIKRLDDHREWGWMIVNYDYFRQLASEEQRREKTLTRVHKHRRKGEGNGEGGTLQSVTPSLQTSNRTQTQMLTVVSSETLPPPLNTPATMDAWDNWQEHCRQRGNKLTERAAHAQIKKLKELGPTRAIAAITHSIEKNYQGIWEPKDDGKGPKRLTYMNGGEKLTESNAL